MCYVAKTGKKIKKKRKKEKKVCCKARADAVGNQRETELLERKII